MELSELPLREGISFPKSNILSNIPTNLKITPSKIDLVESANFLSSQKTFKEEIQQVAQYFSEFKKPKIVTPFQGTSLILSKDKTKFYFGSREGRIGAASIETKETILDIDLKERTIWTIAMSHNDKFLYSGGMGGDIKKFLVETMVQVSSFKGHTSEVNVVLITKDDKWMFSTGDDGMVIKWDLSAEVSSPIILYKIGCICYGLDLSFDNKFIATVGQDRAVHYFDVALNQKVKELKENDFGITWCVCITSSNTYIAVGDDRYMTYLYSISKWERVRAFKGHTSRVRCITATFDEKYVITGGTDNRIFIWDTTEERSGIQLLGHTDWVKAFIIMEDQRTFYSMSDDCSIQPWRIPKYDNYFILKQGLDLTMFNQLETGHRSTELLILLKGNQITKYDRSNNMESSVIDLDEKKIMIFSINPRDDSFVTVRQETQARRYNKDLSIKYIIDFYDSDLNIQRSHTSEFYNLSSMIHSSDGKYLIIGEQFRCIIIEVASMQVYHAFRSHKQAVITLACSPSNKYVFSFDDDRQSTLIKSYDFAKKVEIKALFDPNFKMLNKMVVSFDDEYLAVLPKNKQVSIWATSKMLKIYDFSVETCKDLKFHGAQNHLYTILEDQLKVYSIPSMVISFIVKFDSHISLFAFGRGNEELIIALNNRFEVWKTPTSVNSLSIYGENNILYDFYKYIGSVVSGKGTTYNSTFNHWVIEPFHMNIMHIFAYFNKIDMMAKAVEENVGFIISRSGISPLDVCFEMNNEQGINFFYKYIKNNASSKPFFTCVLGRSLNRICLHQSHKTKKFLDMMLTKTFDSTLSRFHHSNQKLPMIVFTPGLFTDKASFPKEKFSNEGQALEFLQTYFSLNLHPGSQDSLDFISSLLESQNDLIFNSNFIQTILKFKWEKVRFILYTQAVVYVIYLVLLSAYSSLGNVQILHACFALNLALILYEIFQVVCSKEEYFKDLWNYVDVARSTIVTVIWVRDVGDYFLTQDNLIALVVFISWVRGISYFRIIKDTRYYINLIYEVIKDILPFLSILFYSTIAFSLVFERLLHRDDRYFKYLTTSWEINVGGFDTSDYENWMYLAFFTHTILNPILMLNLLISIMSHTFEKVNENILVADSKELAEMIREGELFFIWKRKYVEKKFLHVCKNIGIAAEENDSVTVLKKMRKRITGLNQSIHSIDTEVAELKRGQAQIVNTLGSFERVLESLVEGQNEIREIVKKIESK
jgi:WD40 repeat protein